MFKMYTHLLYTVYSDVFLNVAVWSNWGWMTSKQLIYFYVFYITLNYIIKVTYHKWEIPVGLSYYNLN